MPSFSKTVLPNTKATASFSIRTIVETYTSVRQNYFQLCRHCEICRQLPPLTANSQSTKHLPRIQWKSRKHSATLSQLFLNTSQKLLKKGPPVIFRIVLLSATPPEQISKGCPHNCQQILKRPRTEEQNHQPVAAHFVPSLQITNLTESQNSNSNQRNHKVHGQTTPRTVLSISVSVKSTTSKLSVL